MSRLMSPRSRRGASTIEYSFLVAFLGFVGVAVAPAISESIGAVLVRAGVALGGSDDANAAPAGLVLPTCAAGQVLTSDGSALSCVTAPAGGISGVSGLGVETVSNACEGASCAATCPAGKVLIGGFGYTDASVPLVSNGPAGGGTAWVIAQNGVQYDPFNSALIYYSPSHAIAFCGKY